MKFGRYKGDEDGRAARQADEEVEEEEPGRYSGVGVDATDGEGEWDSALAVVTEGGHGGT